jgi:DNA-binding MarR family transcriptional regulator
MTLACPECVAGKHNVCTGWGMDEDDNIIGCPCTYAVHGARPEEPPGPQYAGTEGHSGSEASEDRARTEAADGTVSARQRLVLAALRATGADGATWHELGRLLDLHHGQVTSTLSNLHKAGTVMRLVEKRDRSSVYVLPDFARGRETVAQGRARAADVYPHALDVAHVALGPGVVATVDGAEVVWNGRRYHPLDVHDSRRSDQGAPDPEGLFDL